MNDGSSQITSSLHRLSPVLGSLWSNHHHKHWGGLEELQAYGIMIIDVKYYRCAAMMFSSSNWSMMPWMLICQILKCIIVVTYSQIFQTYAYFTFFWAFLKILENTWYKGQFSSLCIFIMFFFKYLKILLFEHLRKILVFRMSLLWNACMFPFSPCFFFGN
jgi:hypothetical protein